MESVQRFMGAALALSILGASSAAAAQSTDRQSEIVYLTPFLGAEYVGIRSAALQSDFQGVNTTRSSGVGMAYGAHAGVVLGSFRLGLLYQQTRLFNEDDRHYNKLYLEAGLRGRRGVVGLNVMLAGGWAFFGANGLPQRDGVGGRLSFAADFYLTPNFSLGPELNVDGAAYFGNDTAYGAWGVTGALRMGLHL